MTNLALALFNLIPGYPLDGGRVLRALVWRATRSYARGTRVAAGVGTVIAYGFIVGGVILLFNGYLANGVLLAFIGWFVLMGARASAQELTLRQELAGVSVGQVMPREVATARAGATLAQALGETFLAHNARAGAVEREGRFVGLVTLSDLARVPQERWAETRVEAAMTPLARLVAVAPADPVFAALERMQGGSFNQLPVV